MEKPPQLLRYFGKRTYLYRLYKHPGTFLFLIGFVGLNLFFNFRKVECPPFYFWDLYSLPYQRADTFTNYILRYNHGKLLNKHTLLNHQSGIMFTYTIEKYAAFRKHGLQQSPFGTWPCHPETERRALRAYPAWLKAYTAAVVGEEIHSTEVYEMKVSYRPDGRIKTLSSTKILSE